MDVCQDCAAPAVGQFDLLYRNTPGPHGEDRTVVIRGARLCASCVDRRPGQTFPMAPPPPGWVG